ncbi:MAG: zinc ribbon domain-containing protein [Methanothrix sp.]
MFQVWFSEEKENRNGKTFKCKSCGFQIDADLNAPRNIATFSRSDRSRLSVNQPIVAG